MKRRSPGGEWSMAAEEDNKMKKIKVEEDIEDVEMEQQPEEQEDYELGASGFMNLDDNLIFEVMKHVDARTLGMASCVSKQWYKTAQDERLWELICTRHWNNIGCGNQQLRSVVLALGGFRRLHSLSIWPFMKPAQTSSSTSASAAPASALAPSSSSSPPWDQLKPKISVKNQNARWGKDEMNLSLSLLSIRFYEKMNYKNRGPGK